MATVIDSLLVELTLDPTNFTKGQQDAVNSLRKFEDQAHRNAVNAETSAKRMGSALGGVKTQALELFAIFTGGAGAIEFIKGMTEADAAVGRVSRSTGISASEISKWGGAARLMGGDAAGMAQQFIKLNDAFEGFRHGFGDPAVLAMISGISKAGGIGIDPNKGVIETYLGLADNLHAIAMKEGPGAAGAIGRRFGLDPSTLDMLIKGRDVTKQILEQAQELGPATKNSADAAGELVGNWNKMILAAEGLSRVIGVQHALAKFFGSISEIIEGWSHGKVFVKGSLASKMFGGGYEPKSDPNLFGSGAAGGKASGAFTAQSDKEKYIRGEAIRNGIDPDVAMRVARSEGFNNFQSSVITKNGSREKSWGAFQLYTGGGLGNEFQKSTGLDPSDPANERATIQFALANARKNGWGAFHGAANTGIGNWQGINKGGSATTTNTTGPITIHAGPNASAADVASKVRDLSLRNQHDGNQSSIGGE